MKIDVGYSHSIQSDSPITINDKHYLAWCREQLLNGTDEFLLTHEETIIEYLNYDPQFLSELIGWGESDTIAHNIDFKD